MTQRQFKALVRIYAANLVYHTMGVGVQSSLLTPEEHDELCREMQHYAEALAKQDPLNFGELDEIIKYVLKNK